MTESEIIEEALQGLEGAANFLRGATLDPAIPRHVKDAMRARMEELDELVTRLLEETEKE